MRLRRTFFVLTVFAMQPQCTCGSTNGAALDATADSSRDAGREDGREDSRRHDDAGKDATGPEACDNTRLHAGCVSGSCRVTAAGDPLPKGAFLTITEMPASGALADDTLAPHLLCSIAVSRGVSAIPDLTLSMTPTATPAATATLFQYKSAVLSDLVPTSQPSASDVVGLVTAPGSFGITENPAPWSLAENVGVDVALSGTEAELLRDLSSQSYGGAFYDGTHLIVSNGPRVLIYDGIPANPGVKPDVVVGQPDLDTLEPQSSSSLFGGVGAGAVWSDGTRLVVANGNRVLIWNELPTANLTPADIVLGQPDFSSNSANNGGVSAASLDEAWTVDSDGTQLIVADLLNNRFLLWSTFPTTVDQPADFEVGQPNFQGAAAYAGAIPIYEAWGAVLDPSGPFVSGFYNPGVVHIAQDTENNPSSDFTALGIAYSLQPPNVLYTAGQLAKTPSGGLAIRDSYLSRIAVLKSLPTGPVPRIDFVLGQPDGTRVVAGLPSASQIPSSAIAANSGLGGGPLFTVPDGNRLLVFDTVPTYNFEPASRVIGQAGFSTSAAVDYRDISASTLAGPADVSVAAGVIAVADRGNNRVLLYPTGTATGNGPAATVVLGQPDATSYVPDVDQETPSATTLSGPAGVALDGTHLIVADTENHRVLIWNTVPTSTGTAADIVLGQTDFTGRRPNAGRGDADGDGFSDAGPDGFFYPMGVASDGTHLFVADRMNNRVLGWSTFPTSNDQQANIIVGQADFTSLLPNASSGSYTCVANGLNLPTGVTLAGTSLWIADTENNRVVRWDGVGGTLAPALVVGQASLTSVSNPNYEWSGALGFETAPAPATAATSMLRPRDVVLTSSVVYVTEMDSNRVHMFDATSFAPLGELGQSSDTAGSPNTSGVTASSTSLPLGAASDGTHLWVTDSGNHRVLAFPISTPPSTGAAADFALGQVTLLTNGFNQSSTAADGATSQPRGLAVANGNLYIADTLNSRVLVMKTPVAPGDEPVTVYGQPNGTLALQNSGGAPSASTLNEPRGVFADSSRVLVADTANHRVLVYPVGSSTAATLVLGQSSFSANTPNAGGASASTMQGPQGAYTDGTSLWVADTGNHRVLGWKTFPTTNGQPADFVLGQSSFAGVLGNRGTSDATASTLSFPSDVRVVNGVFYVADSGNNRVLSFSTPPTTSGAAADGVLGQPDFTSRTAAVVPTDLSHMAGPVALSSDPENLYVADRDIGRALVFHIGTLSSGAVQALGSAGGLILSGPGGIAAEPTPLFTSNVYVSNTGASQIAALQSVGRLVEGP